MAGRYYPQPDTPQGWTLPKLQREWRIAFDDIYSLQDSIANLPASLTVQEIQQAIDKREITINGNSIIGLQNGIPTVPALPTGGNLAANNQGVIFQGALYTFQANVWSVARQPIYYGTHANRFAASTVPDGTFYYETAGNAQTDRNSLYQSFNNNWVYRSGRMVSGNNSLGAAPGDLGATDTGFIFEENATYFRTFRWTGNNWAFGPGELPYQYVGIVANNSAPAGWARCDGNNATLALPGANNTIGTVTFLTPNFNGQYPKGGNYGQATVAPTAPTFAGNAQAFTGSFAGSSAAISATFTGSPANIAATFTGDAAASATGVTLGIGGNAVAFPYTPTGNVSGNVTAAGNVAGNVTATGNVTITPSNYTPSGTISNNSEPSHVVIPFYVKL